MKLSKDKSDEVQDLRHKAARAYGMREGDSISIGVTHEIEVKGDRSWIKFEGTTVVGPEETSEEAQMRLGEYVNQSVMRVIEETVNTINGLYEKS